MNRHWAFLSVVFILATPILVFGRGQTAATVITPDTAPVAATPAPLVPAHTGPHEVYLEGEAGGGVVVDGIDNASGHGDADEEDTPAPKSPTAKKKSSLNKPHTAIQDE